jgi:small-conductance mechanosensitive channel
MFPNLSRPRLAALAAWLALSVLPAAAQDGELESLITSWDATAERAERILEAEDVSAPVLESLRGNLAVQRSDALEYQVAAGKKLAALNRQLAALGPAPAEGESEAESIAAQRQALQADIAVAREPVLAADAAYRRTDELIAAIDAMMREQFTRRLVSIGPSPAVPGYWGQPLIDLHNVGARIAREIGSNMSSAGERRALVQRLPVVLLLVFAGLALVVSARRWILTRVEETLRHDPDKRTAFWLAALLNLTRLLLPALGAAALLWAVQLSELAGATGRGIIELLPQVALVLIAAGWVGHSVFSPNLPGQRLLALDDAGAVSGRKIALGLGVVLSLSMLLDLLGRQSRMTAESLAVLNLPLVAAGAFLLFRLSRLIRPKVAAAAGQGDGEAGRSDVLGDSLLLILSRALAAASLAAPALALAGYYAASRYLTFPPILTLGLIGGLATINALVREGITALSRAETGDDGQTRGGLLPVLAGFLIICASLPLIALTWGARTSDLTEIWHWLRDGVTIGGSRVSLTDFLTFVVVFGAGYTVTRLVQNVVRTTVLPRTNLDIGGRNALLTGLGYSGYFLAAVLAISATGLDLSNFAIVAGALSVGVGFGLQAIVSNFVSGIILLIERPVKDGDWIEITGYSGLVRKISVRSTRIETFDKASVIIPNSELISKTVLNWTHSAVSGRLRLPVRVGATAEPRAVEAALLKVAAGHAMVLRNPQPQVMLLKLGDPNEYELRTHIRNITLMPQVTSDLNYEIVRVLADPALVPPPPEPVIRLANAAELAGALGGPKPAPRRRTPPRKPA